MRSFKIAIFTWSEIGEYEVDRKLLRSYVVDRDFDYYDDEKSKQWDTVASLYNFYSCYICLLARISQNFSHKFNVKSTPSIEVTNNIVIDKEL